MTVHILSSNNCTLSFDNSDNTLKVTRNAGAPTTIYLIVQPIADNKSFELSLIDVKRGANTENIEPLISYESSSTGFSKKTLTETFQSFDMSFTTDTNGNLIQIRIEGVDGVVGSFYKIRGYKIKQIN